MNQDIVDLKKIISDAKEKIKYIQASCPHPAGHLYFKHCGSSGGWDNEASYWYEWKCTYCDSRWTTPQDYNLVLAKPHAIEFEEVTRNKW